MRRRLAAALLALMVGFTSIVSSVDTARAAPTATPKATTKPKSKPVTDNEQYDMYYEEYATSITDRCIEFQGYLENIGSKQFGLLYSLRILTQYSEHVYFLITFLDAFENSVSNKSVSDFEEDLSTEFGNFNSRFGNDGNGYNKLKLDYSFTGRSDLQTQVGTHATAKKDLGKFLVVTVPTYINQQLKKVQDKITQCNGNKTEEDKVKAEYTTLLVNVYNIYDYMIETQEDLQNISPFNEDGDHCAFNIKYNKKSMEDALKASIKGYEDLMMVAEKALAAQQTDEDIVVDLNKHYIDNLSDAISTSTGVEIPESPKLSKLYYAIMSASSVYVPMQSYAGSTEFQAALKSLTNDDQEQLEMVEFYSSVKDLRKPLYKRELDEKGYPTGTAKIVTIQSFLDDINKGNSGALCSVLGKFRYSQSSNSWLYYQDTARTRINTEDTDDSEDSSTGDTDTTDDSLESFYNGTDDTDEGDEDETDSGWTVIPNDDGDVETENNDPNESASVDKPWWDAAGALLSGIFGSVAKAATPDPAASSEPEQNNGSATTTLAPANNPDGQSAESGTSSDEGVNEGNGVIDDNAVYAYKEITDETKLTDAQFLYGCKYTRDIDNMTFGIMRNIVKSCANINYISDKSTRYLYVNAFGDIVTDDNMVIFPGIANPLLYQSTEKYNPFTVAFMNTYPIVYKTSGMFKLTNKSSIGKYLVAKKTSGKSNETSQVYAMETQSISSIKRTSPLTYKGIVTQFSVDGQSKHSLLAYRKLKFDNSGSTETTGKGKNETEYMPLIMAQQGEIGGVTVFPYIMTEDVNYDVAQGIARNMYWFLTTDSVTGSDKEIHRFNDNYVLHNFVISGVYGTNNPKGFSANQLDQYTKYVEGSSERWLKQVIDQSKAILDKLTKIQGVIGLRDALQSPILSTVLVFCRHYFYFYLLLVAIILLIGFAKMRVDMFQMAVKMSLCLVVSYLSITLFPAILPGAFNLLLNNPTEKLTYKITATELEKDALGEEEIDLNDDGTIKINADSLTLYRAGAVVGFNEFLGDLNVEPEEVAGGRVVRLNDAAGFYAEGDKLKVSTRKLFGTLRIMKEEDSGDSKKSSGKDKTTYNANGEAVTNKRSLNFGGSNVIKLKAYKTVSNNVDYYAPFYQIVDSFIDNMNKFQDVAEIPRTTIVYSNGTIKDNFLVYSFVNSDVFLTPGVYTTEYDSGNLKSEEEEQLALDAQQFEKELSEVFGTSNQASDFLGLRTWLTSPSDKMRKTLWYHTMQKTGYYNPKTGEAHKTRMNRLIEKVNKVTRDFIYDNDELIGQVSDETMIKLIATRALVALCQEVSDFTHWVYPYSLNYGDFSLGEVLNSVLISNYNKYVVMNFDLASYVGYTDGWFNLIVLDVVVILLFVIVWVVQNLVPVMYLMLCCLLIFKLLAQGDSKLPVKGFLKCSAVIIFSYTALALSLVVAEKMNGAVVAIYLLLLIGVLIAYLLSVVVTSVVTNLSDLGNEEIGVRLTKGFKMEGIRNKIDSITTGNFMASKFNRNREHYNTGYQRDDYDRYEQYRYDSPVEDYYNSYGDYGGYSDYDEEERVESSTTTTSPGTSAYEDVEDFSSVTGEQTFVDVEEFSEDAQYNNTESEGQQNSRDRDNYSFRDDTDTF